MPIVSVIVPVYKVEKYIRRCVDSILSQSFHDFELILVDDGSPDLCGTICDEYALKDTRVRVIHQDNMRLSAARNTGINYASGDWIAFVDADDWIHKDYLSILLSGALKDTDIVIGNCVVTCKENEEDIDYSKVIFTSASLKDIYADHMARTRAWGRILRKNTIGGLRYISGTEPTEDSCFNELLYRNDMKFRITDAKLYYYFMRPDSAIHTHTGRESLNAVMPLFESLFTIEETEKRSRIIGRCYKYILSARYGEMFADDYDDINKQCKVYFDMLSDYCKELSTKDQIIMHILKTSPLLYRIWRIVNDPSLLKYEKELKNMKRIK